MEAKQQNAHSSMHAGMHPCINDRSHFGRLAARCQCVRCSQVEANTCLTLQHTWRSAKQMLLAPVSLSPSHLLSRNRCLCMHACKSFHTINFVPLVCPPNSIRMIIRNCVPLRRALQRPAAPCQNLQPAYRTRCALHNFERILARALRDKHTQQIMRMHLTPTDPKLNRLSTTPYLCGRH